MIDSSLLFEGSVAASGVVSGTAITVSRVSTNVLDMLANRDVGIFPGLAVSFDIVQAFTAAGAATLVIDYQTSADNATFVTIFSSPAYPVANLTVGANIFRVDVPRMNYPDIGTPNRYHRLNYTVATGPMTAGAVVAYLGPSQDIRGFTVYPRNYNTPA